MRYLSLIVLAVSILLPPLLYIYSVDFVEKYLKTSYTEGVESVYMGDTGRLFSGETDLGAAIGENINDFLSRQSLIPWGVRIGIVVMSKKGKIVYPSIFDSSDKELMQSDPMQTAADNYALLSEGLLVSVTVKVDHSTPLANTILAIYISISFLSVSVYYGRFLRRSKKIESEKNKEIRELTAMQNDNSERLATLLRTRQGFEEKYEVLSRELATEKEKANRNEEDLIDEIEELESKIRETELKQQEKQEEIDLLKERLTELGQNVKARHKKRSRNAGAVEKRFKTLYKNVAMHKRSLKGFMDLGGEMKIKCEEIIHQLNADPEKVLVKRKVFHKKSRETVFEVIFAYRGRLYYRIIQGNTIEILSVGTKNTQAKDLEFLDNF